MFEKPFKDFLFKMFKQEARLRGLPPERLKRIGKGNQMFQFWQHRLTSDRLYSLIELYRKEKKANEFNRQRNEVIGSITRFQAE